MKRLIVAILLLFSFGNCFSQAFEKQKDNRPKVEIKWKKNLKGDFSFVNNWEYPLGVEKKSDGKAGCADGGFCPERCYAMLDANGIVLKDSAKAFYELLDTTHIPYSIQCDAWCYEYDGTNQIYSVKMRSGITYAVTPLGIATHCSLNLSFNGDSCIAYVHLNSVMPDGNATFYYKSGYIKIDETEYAKGILKAEFDFVFTNTIEPVKPIYWKGRILTPIIKQN